jgi:hypothetical protein
LILAVTTLNLLKVKDKEVYYVQSERDPKVKYHANFEDGTCSCSDFKHRGRHASIFTKSVSRGRLHNAKLFVFGYHPEDFDYENNEDDDSPVPGYPMPTFTKCQNLTFKNDPSLALESFNQTCKGW